MSTTCVDLLFVFYFFDAYVKARTVVGLRFVDF